MATKRRLGRDDSATRARLLDATQQLMVETGFGAVTSRKIAERVGLSHQSVFYYFGSLDDLFIALIERNSEAFRTRLHRALETDAPVRALWTIACDRESAVIELELKAMSVHNARVRAAMTESLQIYRRIAADFLSRRLPARWDGQPAKAWALVLVLESIGRHLVLDESLAMTEGHGEAIALVEEAIGWLGDAGRSAGGAIGD